MRTFLCVLLAALSSAILLRAQPEPPTQGVTISLTNAELAAVLQFYSDCTGRTLLQHPGLSRWTRFNLSKDLATPAEARKLIEVALVEKGITTIPDGDKFIMVVPKSTAPFIKLAAPKPQTDEVIPPGMISFNGTEMFRVLKLYADLIGKKLEPVDQLQWSQRVYLKTVTPTAKNEATYLLKTLIGWGGVDLVPAGEGSIKAVRAYKN